MSIKRKGITAAIALAVGAAGLSMPAQAHDGAGWAIGAGLLGLGVGAAIASDHPHHYRRYYGSDDYAPPPPPPEYYAPPPRVYYAPPPPPPSYGYDYVQHCRVVNRWNPDWGQYQQVRRCW